MTKLAIFDVDGTLFNGNLGTELVKKLVQDNVFEKSIGDEIFSWYNKYKSGEVDKVVAVDACYKFYNVGLKGHSTNEIKNVASQTWTIVKNATFPFTQELIRTIKTKNYIVVLLSGSPIEMVSLFGNEYGVNENNILAGISETKDGVYTGNSLTYPGSSEQKVMAINKYITENGLDVDWNNSIGMGDNERDAGILALVKHSFAINPNEALRKISEKNSYGIVNEFNALNRILEVIN